MSFGCLRKYRTAFALAQIGILSLIFCSTSPAFAQQQADRCRPYEIAVQSKTDAVAVIPDRLLVDWKVALPCLTQIIGKMLPSDSQDQFNLDTQNRFLSATSAIRAFITDAKAKDKIANSNSSMIEFIREFRQLDNIDVTQALNFGLRQENGEVRSNALLILGNVIDNKTLCVPIDHIYDPRISVRGRANILAVVSVVAPWAYAENFDNICRMAAYAQGVIARDQTLSQTNEILVNLRARLDTQTDSTNQSARLPNELNLCYSYKPRWAGKSLVYENKRSYKLKCQPR
jgi:hypothetical protein